MWRVTVTMGYTRLLWATFGYYGLHFCSRSRLLRHLINRLHLSRLHQPCCQCHMTLHSRLACFHPARPCSLAAAVAYHHRNHHYTTIMPIIIGNIVSSNSRLLPVNGSGGRVAAALVVLVRAVSASTQERKASAVERTARADPLQTTIRGLPRVFSAAPPASSASDTWMPPLPCTQSQHPISAFMSTEQSHAWTAVTTLSLQVCARTTTRPTAHITTQQLSTNSRPHHVEHSHT